MKCWKCGSAEDVALVGPTEWCRSCFAESWAACTPIDNRPQPILFEQKVGRLLIGVQNPACFRVCSVQDFVERFGEGHRWDKIVKDWFYAGGGPIVFEIDRTEQPADKESS